MTMESLHIFGIAGSIRRASYNMSLLKAAEDLFPENADLEIYDRLADIPPYNQDVEAQGDPEPVRDFKQRIAHADGLLIATPEYNYGIPGVLKNAIDWASRPPGRSVLNGKPVALMGATMGTTGTARAQMALRQSFVFTRCLVMVEPEVYVNQAQNKFTPEGELTDRDTQEWLRKLVEGLCAWTQRIKESAPARAAA